MTRPDTGPPPTPNYSANVRAEIARAGRTVESVREAIGLDKSAWYRRMEGAVPWRTTDLDGIATTLGIDMARLWYVP